ncbi:MAG TPA: aminotransferase class IV [Dermatophilaceae bacterium]|nr:aminotransferase class IV [Dermatophilaceae bacterium]
MEFWVAGGLIPGERATVAVLDHGFTVGDGVFETLKTVNDPSVGVVPFAMDRHIARLSRSAAGMGMPMADVDDIRDALLAVCAANPELAEGGRLRITLTSGPGPLGSDRISTTPTLVVAAAPSSRWPAATTLAVSPWPRNERSPLVGLKSTSYAENVLVLARAKSLGAGEALMANLAGEVCEGTGSNIFLVRDGRITTPPLTSGCLAGITRALVVEWCADAGIDLDQEATAMDALASADEIFLTSSTRDVHPVDAVLDDSGQRVWAAGGSTLTAAAAQVFAARSAAHWNP